MVYILFFISTVSEKHLKKPPGAELLLRSKPVKQHKPEGKKLRGFKICGSIESPGAAPAYLCRVFNKANMSRAILADAWAAESLPVSSVTSVAPDSRLSSGTLSSLSGMHLSSLFSLWDEDLPALVLLYTDSLTADVRFCWEMS